MATSAVNPGISTLLQILGKESPALASPAVQAAIQNASPTDIVSLSDAALQAQDATELFDPGASSSSGSSASQFDPATLISSLITNASSGTTNSGATSLPTLLAALQYQQVQSLFS